MSHLVEWMDECFSKELKNVPFKPKDAIHVIVYDDTDRVPPGAENIGDRVKIAWDEKHVSLTYWWKLGSMLYHAEQFADYMIPAKTWPEAFDKILDAVNAETAKRKHPVRIASLQFWGHGSPGAAIMGIENDTNNGRDLILSDQTLAPGAALRAKAAQVGAHMHPEAGHVWFRCCSPFQGSRGQAFARSAAAVFGVPVVGHTFGIHVLQSGTRVLRPGAAPDWDTDEGRDKRGRDKGELLISSPIRRRTVTMFRLYPPMDNGEIILPAGLTAAVARGIRMLAD